MLDMWIIEQFKQDEQAEEVQEPLYQEAPLPEYEMDLEIKEEVEKRGVLEIQLLSGLPPEFEAPFVERFLELLA